MIFPKLSAEMERVTAEEENEDDIATSWSDEYGRMFLIMALGSDNGI